jgi:glycosyltransferase involved in cell wall biosynthesis
VHLKPSVSVIVCTHNPSQVVFEWVLTSLECQTLPKDQFEVIVVDNSSAVPLTQEALRSKRTLNLTLVREPMLGLTHARCKGILHARSDLVVFVDDDNYFLPDYLEQALAIAAREPEIGHFGGIAMPLYEEPISKWQEKFLPSLGVRDNGPEPITSRENRWGEWEPIGAGMVCRRRVCEQFVELVRRSELAQLLGRKGTQLMSGEDTLFARVATDTDYACSYQPSLRLFHFIRSTRVRMSVLGRTLYGHGRSYVILEKLSRRPLKQDKVWRMILQLLMCGGYRIKTDGFRVGLIQWCWDLGAFRQTLSPTPRQDTDSLCTPLESRGAEPSQRMTQ